MGNYYEVPWPPPTGGSIAGASSPSHLTRERREGQKLIYLIFLKRCKLWISEIMTVFGSAIWRVIFRLLPSSKMLRILLATAGYHFSACCCVTLLYDILLRMRMMGKWATTMRCPGPPQLEAPLLELPVQAIWSWGQSLATGQMGGWERA